MRLNTVIGELLDSADRFNEFLYWFTMLGEPSETEPWGFQLDGHHLIINYFILGDQVVMAPVFLGSEPTVGPAGTSYEGVSVLQQERDAGLALVNALTTEQQSVAILSSSLGDQTMQAGAFQDNLVLPYAVFYYRIQSPVVLIEFDHQAPGPLGQNPDYAASGPTRNHIHSVLRTPNGNDYGKDLLRQLLLAYDHQMTPNGVVHVPRFTQTA